MHTRLCCGTNSVRNSFYYVHTHLFWGGCERALHQLPPTKIDFAADYDEAQLGRRRSWRRHSLGKFVALQWNSWFPFPAERTLLHPAKATAGWKVHTSDKLNCSTLSKYCTNIIIIHIKRVKDRGWWWWWEDGDEHSDSDWDSELGGERVKWLSQGESN